MDCVYCYDGSFEGFLCCVFDSYLYKESPAAICAAGDLEPTLFSVRRVETDEAHARRVLGKVAALSPGARDLVVKGFLTCAPDREMLLYRLANPGIPGILVQQSPGPVSGIRSIPGRL